MNTTELERLELVIDTAGVSRRIELLLPRECRRNRVSVAERTGHAYLYEFR
ncbi:MAG: hypothetical protein ACLP4R_20795 [Solirubrobacteraceae bacterium]